MNKPSIIFDMDGTLFQTGQVLINALQKTFEDLKKELSWEGNAPTDEYLAILGAPINQVWKTLLPNHSEAIREKVDRTFGIYLIEEIHLGNGQLYPNVEQILHTFKKQGYPMYIASNGYMKYLHAILDHFELSSCFVDVYGADKFATSSKEELVEKLVFDYKIKIGIMVGDRSSDIRAGIKQNLYTVGCAFGFSANNELSEAHRIIKDFTQLIDLGIENLVV